MLSQRYSLSCTRRLSHECYTNDRTRTEILLVHATAPKAYGARLADSNLVGQKNTEHTREEEKDTAKRRRCPCLQPLGSTQPPASFHALQRGVAAGAGRPGQPLGSLQTTCLSNSRADPRLRLACGAPAPTHTATRSPQEPASQLQKPMKSDPVAA